MDPTRIALATAAAMAMAAVAAVVGALAFSRSGTRDRASLVGPAFALAVATLFLQQEGWPSTAASRGWLALTPMWASYLVVAATIGAAAAVVGLTDWFGCGQRLSPLVKSGLVGIGVGAAVIALLELPATEGPRPALLAGIAAMPLLLGLGPALERDRGFVSACAVSLSIATVAVLLLESGFAKGALVVGAAGAAVGSVALVSLWRPVGLGIPAGGVALGLLLTGCALGRAYVSESAPPFPSWLWVMPAVAPLGCLAAAAPRLRSRPLLRGVVGVGATLVVIAVTLVMALALPPATTSDAQDTFDLYR